MVMTDTHILKFKFESVQMIEWKQTDKRTDRWKLTWSVTGRRCSFDQGLTDVSLQSLKEIPACGRNFANLFTHDILHRLTEDCISSDNYGTYSVT